MTFRVLQFTDISKCFSCLFLFQECSIVNTLWSIACLGLFPLVERCLQPEGDLERLWWKLFILVNLDLSEIHKNNSGFWTVSLSGTTVCGQDDDIVCIQLSLSSSGGERVRGNTQVPGNRSSHGTPGLSLKGWRTHRSTPARSQAGDLAGKYGVLAPAKDFEATLLGPNPPPGDSDQVMLSRDRSPRSESKYPVERPSSCDTGHNARLAMKGLVQQSLVDRPVYSEHAPVTPGPGTGTPVPGPGAWCSVPPTTPGKQGTVTTPGIPIIPGSPSSMVTPGTHWSESSIGKGRPVPGPV